MDELLGCHMLQQDALPLKEQLPHEEVLFGVLVVLLN
jgi:hypothetical protein